MFAPLRSLASRSLSSPLLRSLSTKPPSSPFAPPMLFSYEQIASNLTVADGLVAIENAFAKLAKGEVDVPVSAPLDREVWWEEVFKGRGGRGEFMNVRHFQG